MIRIVTQISRYVSHRDFRYRATPSGNVWTCSGLFGGKLPRLPRSIILLLLFLLYGPAMRFRPALEPVRHVIYRPTRPNGPLSATPAAILSSLPLRPTYVMRLVDFHLVLYHVTYSRHAKTSPTDVQPLSVWWRH